MTDNPFDQFDAPKADANPFDQFDKPAKALTRPAPTEPGYLETAGRAAVGGIARVAGDVPFLAGGLAGAVGATSTADKLFRAYDKSREVAANIEGPAPTSIGGRVAQAVGALPGGIASLGANSLVEPAANVVKEGGTLGEAGTQLGLNTAANVAGLGIGSLGKTVAQRVIQQGAASGALNEAARVAGNLTRPADQQQEFDPVELGINVGAGAGLGGLMRPHALPGSLSDAANAVHDAAAADLTRGVDQRLATPALSPPAERPDFVVNSRGQAVPPDQAAATAQGGPGFEQQSAPPPVAPNPPAPAPLALEHQPDITVDSRGRAVVNKGDRNLGQPFGGPGFDEQAPVPVQPAPPAGPLSRAAAAIPKPEGITDEREHGLLANGGVEPGGVSGEAASNAADGTREARNAPDLRQQYADRQGKIDALNTQRKTAGLSEAENTQLHDLRDEHDKYDALTGLLNQKGYDEAVKTGGYTHAAALDLDQFKPLNDTFGHQAGDLVLQRVAQVLHDSSGGDVTVARLHGDEYAGLSRGDPTEAMRKAQEALRTTPFEITYKDKDGNETTHELPGVGITFGVGSDYATADAAAIAAKPKGGRRGTDTGQPPIRPADVQAPAGSATGVDENGRQDAVPGTERAGDVTDANVEGNRQGDTSVSGRNTSAAGAETASGNSRGVPGSDESIRGQDRGLSKDASAKPDASVNAAEPVTAGTGESAQAAGETGGARAGGDVHGEDTARVGSEQADVGAVVPHAQEPAAAELSPRDNPEAFGLPPKPKSPTAGKPNTYIPGPRDFNEHHHDLLDFAALHGGLDPTTWRSAGVDPAQIRPGKDSRGSMRFPRAPLWRKGGLTPDALREAMVERGFLPPDSEHGEAQSEANDAIDKVLGALNQGEKHYTYAGQETQAAIDYLDRAQEDHAEATKMARERGFDSAEAMHAHDAGNFMRDGKPYDGSPREDIPFSKPGQKPGMSRAALSGAIHDVVSKWTGDQPRIEVVQSHDEVRVPAALRNARGFGAGIEGAYHEGTAYLFADAISSPRRALQVLAHEAFGHYGMERAFAKQWPKLVNDIVALHAKAPPYMREVFKSVERRYEETLHNGKVIDPDTFASETLAVMAEHGIHNALMDRVLATMREFLRSLGMNLKFNDAELRQMLVAAKRRVEGERSQGASRQAQPAFAKRDTATTDMFGAPAREPSAEKPVSDKRAAYDAANERARQATAKFREATQQYRDRKIGDDEFLKARAEHDAAQKEFDAAEHAYKTGKPVADLFGGATSRDHVDAAVRAKEDKLSGKGAAPTMRQGAGELFAGGRPEQTHIEAAARESAAHPENPRPEPTPAQHEAGNFKMGHTDVNGMDVTIEVPKGGMRKGAPDENGKPAWERAASDHYGYIKRTVGADGEQVDVYLGPHAHDKASNVFVVDQVKKDTGKFDEHKAMIGYASEADAVKSYRANFPADLNLVGGVKKMSMDEFRNWVDNGDLKKPAAERGPTKRSYLATEERLAKEGKLYFSKADSAGLSRGEENDRGRMESAAKAWREKGTDSPFFKRWFGKSAVELGGDPQVVFHGTGEDFNVFEHGKLGESTQHATAPLGFHFTTDRVRAEHYAENASEGRPANERVVSAYLKVENPYRMKLADAQAIETPAQAKALRTKLETAGHDGIQIPEAKTWIAFKPEQVKSVENRGTFEGKDIRFAKRDPAERDLIVQHNLTAEKLAHADRMGGLAVPSLAITRDKQPLTNFGDITLLGDKSMANPRESGAKVYGADAYSPRYPEVQYKVVGSALKKLNATLAPFRKEGQREIYGDEIRRVDDLTGDNAFRAYVKANDLDGKYSETRAVAEKMLRESGAEEKLFKGYTYSGNRRYGPHTLENVVKELKKNLRGGENFNYGVGSLRAKFTPQFRSIEQIRKEKGRIVSKADFEKVKKDVDKEFFGIVDDLRGSSDRGKEFSFTDTVLQVLEDAPKIGLQRALADFDMQNVSDETKTRMAQFLTHLRNMPTEYFEGVIPRAVGLHEFKAAVVPHDTPASAMSILQKHGLDVEKYKRGDEEDRKRAINAIADRGSDIRFSVADRKEADKTADAIKQVAADNRENVRNDARAAFAQSKRNTGTAMEAVRALRDEFDKRIAALKGDYKKLYAGISALERGEKTDDPLSNALWQSSHALLGEQLQRLNTLGADIHERVNYFSHIWKDQGRAVAEDTKKAEAIPIGQRRPLAGNKYYTKERVFETITDGLNAGREPISANPVDMFMARYAQGEKLAGALNIRQAIEGRGLVKPIEADRVPHGYARVNDGVFAGKALPELIARDLNNHLDPGLGKYKAWRDFRYAQNLLLSSRLGLSMFHAGMTTLDSMATHIDIGMRRAIGGDLKGAMHDLFAATRAPLTAAQELAGKGAGSKLVRQWYGKEAMDANTRALLDMAMEGGARARMDATDYNHSMTAFRRAWVQGDVRTQLKSAVPAAIEMTTHHIAQNLVPAQKMTARVLLLKFELDRLADKLGKTKGDYAGIKDELGVDALRQISRKVNADVDDRLGQFAYENEFWNRILKDAAHAGIQSVGWNFGSLRLIGGGVGDVLKLAKPEAVRGSLDKAGELTGQKMSPLTNRLSYLITLNAVVAAMGAMTQYALTGQTPQETKDWFFPKTGRKNSDDSDERLAFPSYVKDEYAFSHHFLQTIQHKLHPSLSMAAEMFENRDFYGNEIVDPEAPWPTEAREFMQYLGKSFLPYSIQGAGKNLKNSDSVGMTVAPFFGVTPAPGDVTKSAFQQYISERYFESKAGTTKTPEQAAQGQALSDAINAKKAGQPVDTSKLLPWQKTFLNKPLAPLPEHLFEKMLGRSGGITFQQALHAYEIATPAERARYRLLPLLRKTAAAKIRQLPQEEQQDARERLNALEK